MGVTMDKPSDHATESGTGAVANDGVGQLRIMGGLPTRKINGAAIRVSGYRYAGRRITCVAIEWVSVFAAQVTLISADGIEHSYGDLGTLETLRDAWLRRTVADGTFAGVGRMR
jgi:hypothetical protein